MPRPVISLGSRLLVALVCASSFAPGGWERTAICGADAADALNEDQIRAEIVAEGFDPNQATDEKPSWLMRHDGARFLQALRPDEGLEACANDPLHESCSELTRANLDAMIEDQDIVYFVDICALYACRHAPYAAKLGICDNLSPKRTVVSKLYQSGKVNLSDIGHCANNDPACSETVRGIMDNMVSHSHKPFVQFLNNIMLYVCDKAKYADELAVCVHA